MNTDRAYDVVVVGGGPAGSTVAALVAQYGYRVLLLERDLEPRFKVGESLMPATYWTFKRLGVLEQMKSSRFVSKQSVQFFSKTGKASSPFYFTRADPHESSITWQVLRSEFDEMLLQNSRDIGVDARRGWSVQEVLMDDERAVGVRAYPNGDPSGAVEINAQVVVDASGQSALMSRKLRLIEPYPRLENASIFTHYKGAYRDQGVDEGATVIMSTENQDSWFWYIPLPEDVISVGVVGQLNYLIKGRSGTPQETFEEELRKCPALPERLEKATQLWDVKVLRDFSYRSKRIAGDGWVLVGDAFGFLDPIYSSGVFLALKSGEFAADAIHEALQAEDPSAARLGNFGPQYLAGVESIRKLVYAFYSRDFSFAKFLQRFPECKEGIVDLLVGNVYRKPVDGLLDALGQVVSLPREETLPTAIAG